MKLVIDGVAFQLTTCERVETMHSRSEFWTTLIRALARFDDLQLLMLDRGGAPSVAGVEAIPFPSLGDRYGAADSELLQRVAEYFDADAFLSTGWTTPLRLPTLLMLDSSASSSGGESELALAFARHTITLDVPIGDDAVAALASDVHQHLITIVARHRTGVDGDFYDRWANLRMLQIGIEV